MTAILIKYWKPLAAISVVMLLALWCWHKVVDYGDQRYAEGKAQAIADQKSADEKEEARRNAEKQKLQADAQQRVDAARNDAVAAAAKSGKLQQQLANIRKQLGEYTGTESTGNSATSTGVLLSRMLEESVERNRELAEYADRAREAGIVCEKQYKSLMQ